MNEEQIEELTRLVNTYVDAHRERIMVSDGERRRLWAARPLLQEYAAVRMFLSQLPICREQYSDQAAEEMADDLLTAALQRPEDVDREVQRLGEALARPLLTLFYVPLDGIALEGDEWAIGALNLVQMHDQMFEERVIHRIADILRDNPHYDEAEQIAILGRRRNDLASLIGRVCAEVPTTLDIPRTFEFASKQAVRNLCDFLQFSASFFLSDDGNRNIAWATDAINVWRHAFAMSDGVYHRSNVYAERQSVGQPFMINPYVMRRLEELRLDRIADMVGRNPSCEYDEMLQTAIRWFAKGEREAHPDDRKLSYVTAVDLFFSQVGRGATERICKGFAFAIAGEEEHVPSAARYMFHAFASRSATSHEGLVGILSDDDLKSLRTHVQHFIVAMLHQPFRTKKDVRRWLASREAALSRVTHAALREATDWKVVKGEESVLLVSSNLDRLRASDLFPVARSHESLVLANTIRDAVREEDKWGELIAIVGRLSKANESTLRKLDSANARRHDALIYLNTVIRELKSLPWIIDAMGGVP